MHPRMIRLMKQKRAERNRAERRRQGIRRYGLKPIPDGPPVRYVADQRKTVRCVNEFNSGTAEWVRTAGIWSCVKADRCLAWMKGKSPESAKLDAVRRGFSWEWS